MKLKDKPLFFRFLPPIILYGIIFYLSSRPASSFPDIMPDIVPHFIEYLMLSYFFMRALRDVWTQNGQRKIKVVMSIGVLLALACLDELHQYFVPTRFFELKDILVDFAGILFGVFLYMNVSMKVKK